MHLTGLAAVQTDASPKLRATGDEIAARAMHDPHQVIGLDHRILVCDLSGEVEALLGNFASLMLVATDEVECTKTPEGADLTGGISDLPAELTRPAEGFRCLGRSPAAQRNQRIAQVHAQGEL